MKFSAQQDVFRWIFVVYLFGVSIAICPNWCNQRGKCSTTTGGDGECLCDVGFTGDDCGYRLCPMAYDPVTLDLFQNRRTVRVKTTVEDGIMSGFFQFSFAGSSVLLNADASEFDDFFCTNTLALGLKSVGEVSCKREEFDQVHKTGSYLVTLLSYPIVPFLSNTIYHTGNPPLDFFACNLSQINFQEVVNPNCVISDVVKDNLPQYLPCGGRGTCDQIKGVCVCEPGFKGKACEDTRDDQDVNVTVHHGPFFTGSLSKLQIFRSESRSFNLFQARINNVNVTTIRGDRSLIHRGNVSLEGGRLTISSSRWNSESLRSANFAQIASEIVAEDVNGPLPTLYHFMSKYDGQTVFSVNSTGSAHFAGTVSVGDQLRLDDIGQIHARNLSLSSDLEVAGRIFVKRSIQSEDQIRIAGVDSEVSIGLDRLSDKTMNSSVLNLVSRSPSYQGSLLSLRSESPDAIMIKTINDGLTTFELASNGTVRMNGLRLESGGVEVISGGISVQGGGLTIRGGLTLESGDFNLKHRQMRLGSLNLSLPEDAKQESVIRGEATSRYYSGSLFTLTAPPLNQTSKYSFLTFYHFPEARDENGANPLVRIDGRGFLSSASGARFAEEVTVDSSLMLNGGLNFQSRTLTAVWEESQGAWVVDLSAVSLTSYISIKKPAGSSKALTDQSGIYIQFSQSHQTEEERNRCRGRLLIVYNADSARTSGSMTIPPYSTVLYIFNGEKWVDVEALKAPMNSLTNVEHFEAKKDLAIGNFSFSAAKFQSTSLSPGSIIYVGKNKHLSEHRQKFHYLKGVLHTPGIKVERLVGGIDAQGNEVSNALLSNPKLNNAIVHASELVLSGVEGGLAYFSPRGQLLPSNALMLDADHHLLIKELFSDLNVNHFTVSNININGGTLHAIETAEIGRLLLSSTRVDPNLFLDGDRPDKDEFVARELESSSTHGAIIGVNSRLGGDLVPLPTSYIRFNFTTNVVSVKSLDVQQLVTPLDANYQEIFHAKLVASTFTDIKSLEVEQLVINSLKSSVESVTGSRLVYTDNNGRLQAYSTSESEIEIPNLSVSSLKFSTNSINLQDKVIEHAKLNMSSVELVGTPPDLLVRTLAIEANQVRNQRSQRENEKHDKHFLFSSNTGQVTIIPGVILNDQHQLIETPNYGIKTREVETDALRFSSSIRNLRGLAEPPPLLSVDPSSGIVAPATTASIGEFTVSSKLVVQVGAEIVLNDLKKSFEEPDSSSLLGVDNEGRIIRISLAADSDDEKNGPLNARFHSLGSTTLTVQEAVSAKSVAAEVFQFSPPVLNNIAGSFSGVKGQAALTQVDMLTGELKPNSNLLINEEDNSLRLRSIRPISASPSERVIIHAANLQGGEIEKTTISNAFSVETNRLQVKGVAEFDSDVTITSSLSVYGTVSGSGPYIDTSDERLKENIAPIHEALDLIDQLQAVRYEFRRDLSGFNFPSTPQVGWIAQDVKKVIPEIVFEQDLIDAKKAGLFDSDRSRDDEPNKFYSIAYSHACPILAEGLKELHSKMKSEILEVRKEYDEKVQRLENEIEELKKLVLMRN